MRKHVKPAIDGARIPDPDAETWLPPEGDTVEWTPFWIRQERLGNILVSDAPDETEAGPTSEPAPETQGAAPNSSEPDEAQARRGRRRLGLSESPDPTEPASGIAG